jgi:hypothetical protein
MDSPSRPLNSILEPMRFGALETILAIPKPRYENAS